ncbi:MAG TPA: hypothetical protein VK714_23445 [Myxococcota bacterium]|nr:hypothetical protein [Myxococcota bacterium]
MTIDENTQGSRGAKRTGLKWAGPNGFTNIANARNWHTANHTKPFEGCPFCKNMNARTLREGIAPKNLPPYDGNNSNRGALGDTLGKDDEREKRRLAMKEEARIRLGSPLAGPGRVLWTV